MTNKRRHGFPWLLCQLLCIVCAGAAPCLAFTQSSPTIQATLSSSTTRQPAKTLDTVFYQATLINTGDTSAFNVFVNRIGDPNTTLIPSSLKSTPIAFPAQFENVLEDQPISLLLKGLDLDGDSLRFSIIETTRQGMLSGITALSDTTAELNYQPNTDISGTDTFTFAVTDDDGNPDTSAIILAILPVNDAPSFTPGAPIEVLEDAGNQSITSWATNINTGPADEAAQTLEFKILNNTKPDLFLEIPVLNADGTLTFRANPDSNGIANIVLQLKDNGGTINGGVDTSAPDTLMITIIAVNDAPSFVKGQDIVLTTANQVQTFPNWATDIKAGPIDEQNQTLIFLIEENDNTPLFEEGPNISADGTLTFKPAPDAVGVANIKIRLKDDGGTDNAGVNVSDIQIFSITLEPGG